MYILLKTDKPNNIEIKNGGKQAHYFYAENLEEAKIYINELKDTEDKEYWENSYYQANPKLEYCKEFNNYLKNTVLETNKLSKSEMEEIASEFLYWNHIKPNSTPKISIGITKTPVSTLGNFREYWENLVSIIDKYTQTKHNIKPYEFKDNTFNPVEELGLNFPFNSNSCYYLSHCGALNKRFYKLLYYFDFLDIKIHSLRLKNFWRFYKKTMSVYAIGINNFTLNELCIIPKPDEISIKNRITHCTYDNEYYCDGIKVPQWLYATDKDDLKISLFNKLTNADLRSIFIKKAGIEKFIKKGEIIDSWENYPENEWWAKSEYKLIDMRKILVGRIQKSMWSKRNIKIEYYDYAPFLFMKNQTTGEYHLEGVSPNCKNLYDALKMRYKILNLPDYEIKDIK